MGSTVGAGSSMLTSGIVEIHWRNHAEILAKGLTEFFREQYLVDTDVSIRGETLRTHKLILALFLPTFRKSVDDVNGELHGLNLDYVADGTEDVRALVEFVYTGTVSVSKDRLGHLGRLAQCLQFEGLSKAIGQLCDQHSTSAIDDDHNAEASAPESGTVQKTARVAVEDVVITPDVRIKEEPKDVDSVPEMPIDGFTASNRDNEPTEDDSEPDQAEQLTSELNLKIAHVQGAAASAVRGHTCHVCGANFDSANSHTSHHIKCHKTNRSYRCTACVTELRTLGYYENTPSDDHTDRVTTFSDVDHHQDEDEDQEDDKVFVKNVDARGSPPRIVSSAGNFLKVVLQEVKPDPDQPSSDGLIDHAPELVEQAPTLIVESKLPTVTVDVGREYGCAFCKTFTSRDRDVWIKHLSQAHGLNRNSSSQCSAVPVGASVHQTGASCKTAADLRTISSGNDQFTCTSCAFRFSSSSRLERHVRWMHPQIRKRKRSSDKDDEYS